MQVNVARRCFYHRNQTKPIDTGSVRLNAAVRHIHTEMDATYGSRKMQIEL